MLIKLMDIPGYPKYKVTVGAGRIIQVIPYHVVEEGKHLQHTWANGGRLWRLWKDGKAFAVSESEIYVLLERQKLKDLRENIVNETKTSLSGIVQTGDYIVGSLTKATGLFSASTIPARHLSEHSAKQEAARLAAVDKTKKYVVLNVKAIASIQEINWE